MSRSFGTDKFLAVEPQGELGRLRRAWDTACIYWVGAGTRDTGFSLTSLTFQVTHATDSDTIAERDYIVRQLCAHGVIAQVSLCRSGEPIGTEHVNYSAIAFCPASVIFIQITDLPLRGTSVARIVASPSITSPAN
jgi:hypothetical protein